MENRWPSIFTPPPLVSIRRGWPCFSGLKGERFSGRKKEEERGNEREKKERERGRERKEKREEKKKEGRKREEERSTTNRLVGIERGFCAGYAALVGMEGKRRAIRRRRRGGGV